MPIHTKQERQKNRKRGLTPGQKARKRNLERTGAEIPSTTRGKPDKLTKAQQDRLAARRIREKADFKDKITKIHQLKNDRFRREQEKKALAKKRAAMDKRKS